MGIERQIELFIIDNYDYPEKVVKQMTLQDKFSLVGMVNKNKSEEFKLALRSAGYII